MVELAVAGVQLATGVGPVVAVLQITPAPLAFGADGVQVATPTGAELTVAQVVAVQLLPDVAEAGVQVPTLVGPVVTTGQVVVV